MLFVLVVVVVESDGVLIAAVVLVEVACELVEAAVVTVGT